MQNAGKCTLTLSAYNVNAHRNVSPFTLHNSTSQRHLTVPSTQTLQSVKNIEKITRNTSKVDFSSLDTSEVAAFENVFAGLASSIHAALEAQNLREIADWLDKVLYYNVPHGKKNRGMALVKTYQLVASEANVSDSNLDLARLLGWCVEMLQSYLVVLDDVMDKSLTRRGQDCWYRKERVGLMAINDGMLMEQAIYLILKKHFSTHPSYVDLLETFHEIIMWTCCGQGLDMMSTPHDNRPKLANFTMERYQSLVVHKTAYYTMCLPVKLGIILAGKKHIFTKELEDILLLMGEYFQVQDDILDCFGDPSITGKIGTDIEDGKCSWPIVMAFERAPLEDKAILQENYGVNSEEATLNVKQVYKKLEIFKLYESYELEVYEKLSEKIDTLCLKSEIPQPVLLGLLDKIYKRSK